jgi:hypothetical protein
MGRLAAKPGFANVALLIATALLWIGVGPFAVSKAYGAELSTRSLQLSTNAAGAHNVMYTFGFSLVTAGTLGSIEFQFCSNDPFIGDPCAAPFGLDALNAQLTGQSGEVGFNIAGSSSVNDIIIQQAPISAGAVPVSYTFSQVINPTDVGSYYVRILTYASNNGSGPPTDTGGLAFAVASGVNVSAEVPPYLLFCIGAAIADFDCSTATNDYVDFGDFDANTTSAGNTQIVATTNAQSGYSIWVTGTTLTAGNNLIPAMATTGTSHTDASQFGLNLAANTSPQVGAAVQGSGSGEPTAAYDQPNHYRFVSGEEIASAPNADDYRKYTVSYIVNVNKSQPPGVYVNTLTYVATANF